MFKKLVKNGTAYAAAGLLLAWSAPVTAVGTETSAAPETAAVAETQTDVAPASTQPSEAATASLAQDSGSPTPSAAATSSPVTAQKTPATTTPVGSPNAVEVEKIGPNADGFGHDYVLRFSGDFDSATSVLLSSSLNGEGIVGLGDASINGVELGQRAAEIVIHPDDPFANAIKISLASASLPEMKDATLELRVTFEGEPGTWTARMQTERRLMRAFAAAEPDKSTFSCRAGDAYTITADGRLALVRQTQTGFEVPYVGRFPGVDATVGESMVHNALALGGSNGSGSPATRAYEVWSNFRQNFNWVRVYRSDKEGFDASDLTKYTRTGYDYGTIVGGATSPTAGPNDPFYFGRFLSSATDVLFQLYAYEPDTGITRLLGNIQIPTQGVERDNSNNGDIVLDHNGNLYVFWHSGKTVSVIPVGAADLARSLKASQEGNTNKYTMVPTGAASSFTPSGISGASFNGAALDADGTFFVQWSSSNAAPWVAKYDPRSGALSPGTQLTTKSNGQATGLVLGTDLASCQSFPTLELTKTLPQGRKRATDQFSLELWRKEDWDAGRKAFLSATTSGNATGLQPQKAGPFPAAAGASYVLVERGAGTTQHGDYAPTLKCDGEPVDKTLGRKENLAFYEITLPAGKADLVSCEYSNKPQGTVLWQKTAQDTDKPLAGSEWVIRNSGGFSSSVKDCEGDACKGGPDGTDIDPRAGYLKVALPYGTYDLVETKAPLGYRVGDPATRQFTVSSTAPEKNFGAIANPSARATLQWQKVDAESKKLLSGSEWSLVRTGPNTETLRKYPVTITDCVAGDCPGFGDKNPEPGKFSLPNVDPGTYELVETKAPEGYVGGVKKTVSLTADQGGTAVSIGDLKNERQKGSLTWGKIGTREGQIGVPTDPTMLGGSAWTVTPIQGQGGATVAGAEPIVVEDCLASGCTGPDSDARSGYFEVELPIGWYRVEETRAPLGYKLLAQPKEIEVTADGTAKLGNFSNEIVETPKLPKTGGYGIGVPLAAGALIIALGAMLGRRRSL